MHPPPLELVNYPLGARKEILQKLGQVGVAKIYGEERLQELNEIGFCWDHYEYLFWECVIPALDWHQKKFGHMIIAKSFDLPSVEFDEYPIPPQCRELPIGMICSKLRSRKAGRNNGVHKYIMRCDDALQKLYEIDFPFDTADYLFRNRVLPSLLWYKETHGNLMINTRFQMPDDPDLPKFLRKFRLGPCVNKIRGRGDYVRDSDERLEQLEEIGFIWGFDEIDQNDNDWSSIGAPHDVLHEGYDKLNRETRVGDEKYNVPKGLGGFRF